MLKARDYNPAVAHGAKWLPSDLAGIIGQPVVGEIYYVDPTNGSDTGNSGSSWDDALATVGEAYSKVTDNEYDVIILAPGTHTASTESTAITWSKDHVTLVGATAPVPISQRSRVLAGSSVSPLITVSGYGNKFINVQFASWNDNNDLINITGERNYFQNVHFAGMGNATTGDDANGRCVTITDAGENHFEDCTFGVDTVARSTTNATLELEYSASAQPPRNTFRNCRFLAYADNAGALFVKADGANDIDRFVLFEHCLFHNAVNSGATTMTVAMDLGANTNGSVILWDSWLIGATDWADDFTKTEVCGAMVQATNSTAGLALAAA